MRVSNKQRTVAQPPIPQALPATRQACSNTRRQSPENDHTGTGEGTMTAHSPWTSTNSAGNRQNRHEKFTAAGRK